MAYNKAPTATLPGYTSDGTNITIPIASLLGLTAAEANATTGDAREVALAFIRTYKAKQQSLAVADKPATMSVRVVNQSYVSAGNLANSVMVTYELQFYVEEGLANVIAEPV
jgi:hypothetical protein